MKGFNFVVAENKLLEEIICGVESKLHNSDTDNTEVIRQDIAEILR